MNGKRDLTLGDLRRLPLADSTLVVLPGRTRHLPAAGIASKSAIVVRTAEGFLILAREPDPKLSGEKHIEHYAEIQKMGKLQGSVSVVEIVYHEEDDDGTLERLSCIDRPSLATNPIP
jgi:hypothetical protein